MKISIFLISIFVWGIAFSGELNADKVMQQIEKSYQTIQTIEAKFQQTYSSGRFSPREAKGEVWIKKPGRMRWDYAEPKGKLLVSNGKVVTLYDPEDRQAMQSKFKSADELPLALSFLWGKAELGKSFNCTVRDSTKASKGKRVTLHCLPKEPVPNVRELYLTASLGNPVLVVGTKIVDAMGGANEIQFSDIAVNPKISAKRFKFTPPAGTNIVEMGQEGIKLQ